MKANELMVGDWIADKQGDKVRVEDIVSDASNYYNGITVVGTQEWQCSRWTVDFEDAQPIPLTAEILEKNREEARRYRDGHTFEWTWRGKIGYVELSEKAEGNYCPQGFWLSTEGGEYHTMQIRYVHELQHLLRVCGVEKEIEL